MYGLTGKQLVHKLLLQMSIQELHNIMVGPPAVGGLKRQEIYILSSVIQHYLTYSY